MKSLTWNWACVYVTIDLVLIAFQYKYEDSRKTHLQCKANMPNSLINDHW